ncbi:MAG: sigma 54-interacting transcriptional regulator [Sandaracinaceae bacterium]
MHHETRERHPAASIPVRRFSVRVVGGSEPAFEGARATVGAADDCDLVLEARGVSRYHVELEADVGGIRVRDLGSTNGTRAAGLRIQEAVVPSGTVLELGHAAIRLDDASTGRASVATVDRHGDLITRSPAMRALLDRLTKASAAEASVVVRGEPGTGKELVARAIHEGSDRRDCPFVVVDCAALVGPLVTSELFGHEAGAFTDAEQRRRGAFERAAGGTLLLDEVADLALELQPMLLGALERRQIRRVGGSEDIPLDLRVVASTSRDLRREVNAGRFRLDLYYRLAVVKLEVPPLAERLDDLGPLLAWFLERRGYGAAHPLLAPGAIAELAARAWPGNVRELFNHVEAALAWDDVADGEADAPTGDAPPTTDALIDALLPLPFKEARGRFVRAMEHAYVTDLMRRAQGNKSRAGRLADLDRSQLRQLVARTTR